MTEIIYQSISPSDFFYRNREIAGFSNPSRAIYASVRELLENALDACERQRVPPDIFLRLTEVSTSEGGTNIYIMRIEDNGTGLPPKQIPSAFCRVFYGSKYTLQQARGTFGLGGTITILYGQITTHQPVVITSSTGGDIHEFTMMIDIERNEPMILKHKVMENKKGWRGTVVHLQMEGDYSRIKRRLLDYLKQTAMVSPYADITFVDPMGRLFRFERGTETMPPLPQPVKPHPHGIDVENFRRLVTITKARSMKEFMTGHFQGVGSKTADRFLKSAGIRNKTRPNSMEPEDIVTLVRAAKDFKDFKRPDATCLSPIGEELLENGIRKELELTENDFLKVVSRKPSTYLGFPFIVETAIATGPTIRKQFKTGTTIIRFANRIPLLFDESSGVIWKVVNKNIHWNTYNVSSDTPMVVVVHVCSTNVIRTSARSLRLFISRSIRIAKERRRLDIFAKYLPKIAEFSTKLSDKETPPDIKPLLIAVGGKIPDVKKKINEVSTIDG